MKNENGIFLGDNALSWLKNGIWALGLAGLYSIVLVILRTPQLAFLVKDKSLFKSSLIIHVDLSVLAWMLSITCLVWSLNRRYYFQSVFSHLAFVGLILMAISPLMDESRPVMNNYVPILENIWFILGLSLFGGTVFCMSVIVVVNTIVDFKEHGKEWKDSRYEAYPDIGAPSGSLLECRKINDILSIIKITTALIYVMVWLCFALSYKEVMALINIFPIDIDYYYELLFWSGGHLMQFIYTQVVMFVWLILAQFRRTKKLNYYKIYANLFLINFFLSSFVFYGHFAYEMSEYEFTEFFTKHMQYTGGIVPVLFILVLGVDILKNPLPSSAKLTFISTSFIASILLFFLGGLIGILISGINVSIPAHYHGSIVGISIAFLGLSYVFIFKERGNEITKWPNIQLYLITIGQLLHISGLAMAGGYGIMRKNPDEVIATSAKVYMGMMGGGGFMAIIGGLMFVYICARRLYNFRN